MLAELPDEVAAELLARLPAEREQALRGLASHPEHTAGSLMTTDFVALPRETSTPRQALVDPRRAPGDTAHGGDLSSSTTSGACSAR